MLGYNVSPAKVIVGVGLALGIVTVSVLYGAYSQGAVAPTVQAPERWSQESRAVSAPPTGGTRPVYATAPDSGWRLVGDRSGFGVLIIDVEIDDPDSPDSPSATAIARVLVEPLKQDYLEVLIYFRRPQDTLAMTRVQWSPSRGYVEADIAPHPKGS